MKKNGLLAAILILFILLCPTSTGASESYFHNNGNVVKWRWDPIKICIKPSAYDLPDIRESVDYAVNLWTSVPGVPKIFFTEDYNSIYCNIIVDYKSFKSKDDSFYLATNTNYPMQNGDLVKARIDFNKKYKNSLGSAIKNKNVYDIKSIMCHELGHALGLEEEFENKNSVMYQTTFIGDPSRRFLAEQDIKNIKNLYLQLK